MNLNITEIIAVLGGWTLIISAISAWIGKLVAEKVTLKWKEQQKKELNKMTHQLASDRLIMESAVSNLSSGQKVAQEKKIQAIEILWKNIIEIRDGLQSAITFYKILLPSEYNDVFTKSNMRLMISDLNEGQIAQTISKTYDTEIYRPYLGEKLWLLFFIYRAFLGRISHILIDGLNKGTIEDWRKDNAVHSLLENVFHDEQMKAVTNESPIAMHNAITLLEAMILEEISLIMSGEKASKETFKHAKKVGELMGNIDTIERGIHNLNTLKK
jgi:hypothetical protein